VRSAPRFTPYKRRPERFIQSPPPPRYPPIVVASQDLAEGSGTRSFANVTTQAGDYLVVQIIIEAGSSNTFTPSGGGLTYDEEQNLDNGSGDVEIYQWTALDATGATRTVQIAQAGGSMQWRGRLDVVRASEGPGTGIASSAVGQTVSVARQKANSALFMAVGDFSTGAVGSPVWVPGGTTTASQQGAQATYIFGLWDDSGQTGSDSTGISSPSYTTPAIAVLEMLGSDTPPGGGTEFNLN
jgi:hypothetical protein